MPHVQVIGTAWDRCLEDYAYTRDLDLTGWAWEFLRRNADYQRDYRLNRAGCPLAVKHVSGATLYRLRRRFLAAEDWGLEMFADPGSTAVEVDVFWIAELLTHQAGCIARVPNHCDVECHSLSAFTSKRAVLVDTDHEQIVFRKNAKAAALTVAEGTFLLGDCSLTFQLQGISSSMRHHETMHILKSLLAGRAEQHPRTQTTDSKHLHYLIALDGHLEGRSYREIAMVLYGKAAVRAYWTDDTRGLKSKVRRAVGRGKALMKGGYRKLL
jgi:hypothetical protein